jgi:hypothetical protein
MMQICRSEFSNSDRRSHVNRDRRRNAKAHIDVPAIVSPGVSQYSACTVLKHELETLDFLIGRHPLSLYD